jgi:hypothetical protein
MHEIETKFDLVHKMHGDYGHFDLMFPYLDLLTNILMAILIQYMLNLNLLTCILTNIDVVNS